MAQTLLDIIIDLKAQDITFTQPIKRTKNVVYGAVRKIGATTPLFQHITDKSKLADHLDPDEVPRAEAFFDAGLTSIYLLLKDNANNDFIATDVEKASKVAYTLVLAIDVAGTLPAEVAKFDGVKVYIKSDATDADNIALAKTSNTCVVIHDTSGITITPFPHYLFGKFLGKNSWDNMQYESFAYDPKLTTIGELKAARDNQFTFIGQDETTITSPVLLYFRAGGVSIADIYIAEDLRQEIQTNSYNYIKNAKPKYLDSEISSLISVGNNVIDKYIRSGLLQDATYTIPAKNLQKNADVVAGKLANVALTATLAGAVWWLEGTVTHKYT